MENPIVTEPVLLTPAAVKRYQEMMAQKGQAGFALRIRVVSGGCSGMQYEMGFENEPVAEDVIIESNGQKIFLDPRSVPFVKGLKIDYVKTLTGGGFKIHNPQAKQSCGCGESFS